MRVLIVKLSAIGDVIHTIPFLRTIKRNFPKWEIDWAIEDTSAPLLQSEPYLSRLLVINRSRWRKGKGLSGVLHFIRKLRGVRYDMVLDLQGLLKSAVVTMLADSWERVGLSIEREFARLAYHRVLRVDIERHALLRTLDVARMLGAKDLYTGSKIHIPQSEQKVYEKRFMEFGLKPKDYVVINPAPKWRTKFWVKENFVELARMIQEKTHLRVVFTGSKDDMIYVGEITSQLNKGVLDLSGRTTLRELSYLLMNAKAMVSTDTGPMHLGAAMGCPVVALFGPTAPWRTGPFGDAHVVVRSNLLCSPCFKKDCDDTRCMKGIKTEDVFTPLMGLIDSNINKEVEYD